MTAEHGVHPRFAESRVVRGQVGMARGEGTPWPGGDHRVGELTEVLQLLGVVGLELGGSEGHSADGTAAPADLRDGGRGRKSEL